MRCSAVKLGDKNGSGNFEFPSRVFVLVQEGFNASLPDDT
jgi:hypothetical protein